MERSLCLKPQAAFVRSLCGRRNVGERVLGFDRMTNLSLNLIIQTSLKTTLDSNHIACEFDLSDNGFELSEVVDDVAISLTHLL